MHCYTPPPPPPLSPPNFTREQSSTPFPLLPADYIKRYATEAVLQDDEDGSSETESDMSDLSEDEVQDMEL